MLAVAGFFALLANSWAAVALPVLAPGGGSYTTFQNIRVTCATQGAVLHYTLDGTTEPQESDPIVASGGYVVIGEQKTLKVRGFLMGQTPSATKTATYTITGQVACGAVIR